MSKIGWGKKENYVVKIIIDGQSQFDKDSWFVKEAEVILYYYVLIKYGDLCIGKFLKSYI